MFPHPMIVEQLAHDRHEQLRRAAGASHLRHRFRDEARGRRRARRRWPHPAAD